jgi:hypothetical protein
MKQLTLRFVSRLSADNVTESDLRPYGVFVRTIVPVPEMPQGSPARCDQRNSSRGDPPEAVSMYSDQTVSVPLVATEPASFMSAVPPIITDVPIQAAGLMKNCPPT